MVTKDIVDLVTEEIVLFLFCNIFYDTVIKNIINMIIREKILFALFSTHKCRCRWINKLFRQLWYIV